MNNSADPASKIIMQGVHVELTAALQTAIREKFAVLLRHNPYIVRINVRLQRDQHHGNTYHYSATGQVEVGGPDLVATVKGEDAYAVIDGLVQNLDEQVRDRHERRKDKRNHAPSIDQEPV